MEKLEAQVSKNLKTFCKILPSHVEDWQNLLQASKKPVMALVNLAEQLRHVENAKIDHMEDFEKAQKNVQFSILRCIEDDLSALKIVADKLNKINYDFKSKLMNLESSSVGLDWTSDSLVIRGSATQPSLQKLLQLAYDFSQHFQKALKDINASFKGMDVRDEKSMNVLEKSFDVDLEEKAVLDLIAITQYVDNEHLVV